MWCIKFICVGGVFGFFERDCDDFIFIENLNNNEDLLKKDGSSKKIPKGKLDVVSDDILKNIEELNPYLTKAWEQYQDDEGWVNIAAVGNFLKRVKPDFDPRSYGYQKVPQIVERLNNYFEMKKFAGKGTVSIIAYRPLGGK